MGKTERCQFGTSCWGHLAPHGKKMLRRGLAKVKKMGGDPSKEMWSKPQSEKSNNIQINWCDIEADRCGCWEGIPMQTIEEAMSNFDEDSCFSGWVLADQAEPAFESKSFLALSHWFWFLDLSSAYLRSASCCKGYLLSFMKALWSGAWVTSRLWQLLGTRGRCMWLQSWSHASNGRWDGEKCVCSLAGGIDDDDHDDDWSYLIGWFSLMIVVMTWWFSKTWWQKITDLLRPQAVATSAALAAAAHLLLLLLGLGLDPNPKTSQNHLS